MTRFSLLIALLLCSVLSNGQNKELKGIISKNGDTSFWYEYQNKIIKGLSLTRLDTSSLPYYFRIWKSNQVLDVWKTNDNLFFGLLTSWVTEQAPGKEKSTGRILIDKKNLHSDTVQQLFNLIKETRIINLPTDDSIKGWKHGFDGITYKIELLSRTSYSFKTYWTPKAQDTSLKEAEQVQSFVDKIFELSNGISIWKQFVISIPYECYNVGGTIVCKVLKRREKRKYAAERKRYRQQVHL